MMADKNAKPAQGIDWGKVAEQFNPELKDKNKRKCVKHGNTVIVCEDVD